MFQFVSPYEKERNGTQVIKYTYLLFISANVYATDCIIIMSSEIATVGIIGFVTIFAR
jgi:hypothetical protein